MSGDFFFVYISTMLFKKLNISDVNLIQQKMQTQDLLGSDSSIGTMFLLQNRYNTTFCYNENFLFRYYEGKTESQKGYLFPLFLNSSASLEAAVKLIYEDSVNKNRSFNFCLCTQNQIELLNEVMIKMFPEKKIEWKHDEGDSDYIYLQEKLSSLTGSKLQKKRNHVNQFKSIYENQWQFKFITANDCNEKYKEDMLYVLKHWQNEKGEMSEDFNLENESINLALKFFTELKLFAGILYVSGFPVAFTIASRISSECVDIHFEKAVSDYSRNGAFAVINQLFVQNFSDYKYINREEDMNIEGLRKAKLSYKPELILKKFYFL